MAPMSRVSVSGSRSPRFDGLAGIGAVERQRVDTALAVDEVAAVTGVPDEQVVAVTKGRHVVTGTAVDGVIAMAAQDDVVAGAAVEVRLIWLAGRPLASITSSPMPPEIVSWSSAPSAWEIVTVSASPLPSPRRRCDRP